jgi:hypothetical protein
MEKLESLSLITLEEYDSDLVVHAPPAQLPAILPAIDTKSQPPAPPHFANPAQDPRAIAPTLETAEAEETFAVTHSSIGQQSRHQTVLTPAKYRLNPVLQVL